MKASVRLLPRWCSAAALTVVSISVHAATFSVLHDFSGADGAQPAGAVAIDNAGNVIGTTEYGGKNNVGTLFKYDGVALRTLLHFNSTNGANPWGSVLADGEGNVYGTTLNGGAYGYGTVFRYDREAGVKVVKSFAGSADGLQPFGGLTRDADGNLYGSTFYGGDMSCGSIGCGTLFKISRSGVYKQLHQFTGADGYGPNATLYRVKNRLYGATVYAGPLPAGSPFSIKLDGTGFTTVTPVVGYNFMAGFVRDGSGNLWSAAMRAGPSSLGGIYKIDAAGVTTLAYSFSGVDGAYPTGTLVIDGHGVLYGTTKGNGTWSAEGSGEGGYGTVFSYDPTTDTLTTLHTFAGPDGENPFSGLARDPAGNLYGVTSYGGASSKGVLFRVTP